MDDRSRRTISQRFRSAPIMCRKIQRRSRHCGRVGLTRIKQQSWQITVRVYSSEGMRRQIENGSAAYIQRLQADSTQATGANEDVCQYCRVTVCRNCYPLPAHPIAIGLYHLVSALYRPQCRSQALVQIVIGTCSYLDNQAVQDTIHLAISDY